ncbi:MAG: hypothetical protein ABSB33_14505, partial [Tepidisphaeraceae bacterium]
EFKDRKNYSDDPDENHPRKDLVDEVVGSVASQFGARIARTGPGDDSYYRGDRNAGRNEKERKPSTA